MHKLTFSTTVLLSAMVTGGWALADEKQDCPERELVKAGTFEAEVKSVGLIIGGRWGEGTITLNDGTKRNFSLAGAKVLEIGAAKKMLSGTIYNLEKPGDFPGTYMGVGGGLTLVTKGLGGFSVTNAECVVMNAEADKSEGLQVSMPIAPGGVKISFAEE